MEKIKKPRKPRDTSFARILKDPDIDSIYIASNLTYIDADTARYLGNWLLKAADWLEAQEDKDDN